MMILAVMLSLGQAMGGSPASALGALPPPPTAAPLPTATPDAGTGAAPVTPAPVARPAKAAAADRRICRSYQVTGSIMGGKRECHTAREWSAIDARNGEGVAAARDRANASGSARPY